MYLDKERILTAGIDELIALAIETENTDENHRLKENKNPIKFKLGIGRTLFAKAFGFKTTDYYEKPEVCLESQLRWKLYNFHILRDDTPFDTRVGIDYATALEPSLFGIATIEGEGKEPSYGKPVIIEPEDLDTLALPDFYNGGIMPRVHGMYKALCELVDNRLSVFFPGWARGPCSIATMLRGFNELFFDSVDDPDFVHRLMDYIVKSRIHFEEARCEFLGIAPDDISYRWKYVVYRENYSGDMFEDEVDGNLFSADFNREFIIPYTKRLADYYGGIPYYHSCGNLTNFLEDIVTLPVTKMQHVSGWTSFDKAVKIVPKDVALQYSLNPLTDVFAATREHMERRFRELAEAVGGHQVDICADAIYEGSWPELAKIEILREAFRKVVG